MDASLYKVEKLIITVYEWYNKLGLSDGARERRKVKTRKGGRIRGNEEKIKRRKNNHVQLILYEAFKLICTI